MACANKVTPLFRTSEISLGVFSVRKSLAFGKSLVYYSQAEQQSFPRCNDSLRKHLPVSQTKRHRSIFLKLPYILNNNTVNSSVYMYAI